MSDEENVSSNATIGQKRPAALQLGPRNLGPGKNRSSISLLVIFILTCLVAVGRIHLSTLVGILDAQFTHYALLALSSTTAFFAWVSSQNDQTKLSPTSMSFCFLLPRGFHLIAYMRERREHRIFRILLDMIPGLEDHLMGGSDDNVTHISELVCIFPIQF